MCIPGEADYVLNMRMALSATAPTKAPVTDHTLHLRGVLAVASVSVDGMATPVVGVVVVAVVSVKDCSGMET